jgi:hypothetical protein
MGAAVTAPAAMAALPSRPPELLLPGGGRELLRAIKVPVGLDLRPAV